MSPILGIWASQGRISNSYESIATVTVGAGGASDITFSSIPSTYTHLQVRWIARNASSSGGGAEENMRWQINGNTGTNYPWHFLEGNGSSVSAAGNTIDNAAFSVRIPQSNATANAFGGGVLDILDYTNTSKYKTIRHLGGGDKNGSGYIGLYSFFNTTNTNAISSIKAFPQAGSFAQYSSFALYGIKG